MHPRWSILARVALAALAFLAPGEAKSAGPLDSAVFPMFIGHIARQMGQDKQAFAQASTCLSWFYESSKKLPSPPAVQRISWRPTATSQLEQECPRQYPNGMDAARDDFAKTQTLLSVSLTVYEFALVADHDDDQAYSATELRDLFHSLSLAYHAADSPQSSADTLSARFDQWYRGRTLDEVMQGMSILYERGYRMTPQDRAELDRVMQ